MAAPSSTGKAKKGVSLIELLIATALMGLVMTMILELMYYGNRYVRVQDTKLQVQTECLKAMHTMSRELVEADSLAYNTSPDGIVFCSPRSDTGNIVFDVFGHMMWYKFVAFLKEDVNGTPCIVRRMRMLPVPATEPQPPPTVASMIGSGQFETVARNVTKFEVDNNKPTKLLCRVEVKQYGRTFGAEIQTSVFMRN